jgi:hypothetical protein
VFVKPVEDMARHLKMRGANIDLDHLRQLGKEQEGHLGCAGESDDDSSVVAECCGTTVLSSMTAGACLDCNVSYTNQ